MATPLEIRAWVESTRPHDWYGQCAGLTDRVVAEFTGGPRQWYDSATDARKASGPLNPDASACPPGGIHYWSYYGKAWDGSVGDWGHVTIDIYGGGSSTLSATGHAYEYWGVNAGLISVDSQSQRAGMRYLGWSRTYGAAAPLIITTGSVAGGGATPFNPEEDEMASKQEIKDALSEVLASRPDAVLIHYSGEGRNGIYLAAPGYWHQLTAEQWTQFNAHGMRTAIRELIPVNDRDFDVFKEIYTINQGMVSSVTAAQIAVITKSVQDSLKNMSVDAAVDDETIEKIANAAVDRLVARAAN